MAHYITESCIGCSACEKACPVFAISGVRGHRFAVNPLRCVDCGVCGRVCPKGAVVNEKGEGCAAVKRSEWPRPGIDSSLCSACRLCIEECTKEALSLSEPAFKGDLKVYAVLSAPNKCVGCGLCRRVCPLDAIAMEAPQ